MTFMKSKVALLESQSTVIFFNNNCNQYKINKNNLKQLKKLYKMNQIIILQKIMTNEKMSKHKINYYPQMIKSVPRKWRFNLQAKPNSSPKVLKVRSITMNNQSKMMKLLILRRSKIRKICKSARILRLMGENLHINFKKFIIWSIRMSNNSNNFQIQTIWLIKLLKIWKNYINMI